MKERHRKEITRILSKISEQNVESAATKEQESLVEAVFELAGSQMFIQAVVDKDPLMRDSIEVVLDKSRVENKPNSEFEETIVFLVGKDPVSFGEEWQSRLVGRVWMVVDFNIFADTLPKVNPKNSSEVSEWVNDAFYSQGFGIHGKPVKIGGDTWEFHIERTFQSQDSLIASHRTRLQNIFDALKALL